MDVVTASSSASGSPLGFYARFLTNHPSSIRRSCVLAFKTDSSKNKVFVTTQDSTTIPVDSVVKKSSQDGLKRSKKKPKKVKAVAVDDASPSSTLELDYDTVAANLETIYKLSPDTLLDLEGLHPSALTQLWWKKRNTDTIDVEDENTDKEVADVVRSRKTKSIRLSLDNRIALKRKKTRRRVDKEINVEKVDRLVRDYSVSTDLVRMDWKKTKIPEVLPSSEHTRLFNLMQTTKAILEVKENLRVDLVRDPADGDIAAALNMTTSQLKRQLEVGRAARNKLIKHNLRLVLFVINKYFRDFANGSKFHDLCQAGVKGLITSIDRFEQKRGFRLSTYGLFWIRHAIIRSMTVSSFTRVPFGIESIRQEIQKAKLQLMVELDRVPEEDEIIERVGLSSDRYHDIMKTSKQVLSLHSKHAVTQEEFIKGIKDVDGVAGADKRRQPALLRLALDDVLDSLKPKESLVIRQRYGLDGKGDRTLGEIAGNLNISREMVRKHEVKALMKLKHPARVNYLRRYIT